MTYSHLDPATHNRAAWNAGKTVVTKRLLTQKQIWAIRFFFDREERLRDRALFDLAIDSKLRGCDLVKLKIDDLAAGADIRSCALAAEFVVFAGAQLGAGARKGSHVGCEVLLWRGDLIKSDRLGC